MTPQAGKKRVTKILGAKAAWRDNGTPSSMKQRAEAQARAEEMKAHHAALSEQWEALRAKLLSDPDYVALTAAKKRVHEALQKAQGWARYHRITVGTTNSLFFTVEADGDNWADVVRKLEAKTGAGK